MQVEEQHVFSAGFVLCLLYLFHSEWRAPDPRPARISGTAQNPGTPETLQACCSAFFCAGRDTYPDKVT